MAKESESPADGEDADGKKKKPKVFQKEYVRNQAKMLKSTGKQVNFALAINKKKPAESQILLKRKGKPEQLFKALKKTGDFSVRQITYGTAKPDAKDKKLLVLQLGEGAKPPPQVEKLGKKYLRSDSKLRFRKLIIAGAPT